MKCTILLTLILLSSCATQRKAEKHFDENTDKLAVYVDKNEDYTDEYGSAYASKHFPPKLYPPVVYPQVAFAPTKLMLRPILESRYNILHTGDLLKTTAGKTTTLTNTIYLHDTVKLEAQEIDLKLARRVNKALRKQIKSTEAERDYWREKNRKKFWALIAMAIFGGLYITFKVLADRVREV